ncbi:MAG: hypothetical protein JKY09_05605 [Crocinitomicaceae bacterium]|nr:hypothetical protein [Crocinitomicaceae bacterium]
MGRHLPKKSTQLMMRLPCDKVKSLDDLFFFRCFSGQIYKAGNVYDRKISDYMTGDKELDKESLRIDIDLIEDEHDLWIQFSR